MDAHELIERLTRLQEGYLVLQTRITELGERVKKQEENSRAWDVWYAKLGMFPTAVSIILAVVSLLSAFKMDARADQVDKSVSRILEALPKR